MAAGIGGQWRAAAGPGRPGRADQHQPALGGGWCRWARREDTVQLETALRTGLAARGIPNCIYLDNGAAMVDQHLLRACAGLCIRLIHSRPGQPAGRGKKERFFRTVREQFLPQAGGAAQRQRRGRDQRADADG